MSLQVAAFDCKDCRMEVNHKMDTDGLLMLEGKNLDCLAWNYMASYVLELLVDHISYKFM